MHEGEEQMMSGGGERIISQLQRLCLDLSRLIVVDEDGFMQACSECGDGEHGVQEGEGQGRVTIVVVCVVLSVSSISCWPCFVQIGPLRSPAPPLSHKCPGPSGGRWRTWKTKTCITV